MDELLNWKSPLKAAVTYYPQGKGGFEDPVFDAQPTKLKRARVIQRWCDSIRKGH